MTVDELIYVVDIMDHARKIGKSEKPAIWTKRPSPPSSIIDKPLIKDEKLTEDKRLRNWRKWLNDRKKHSKNYGKRNDRDPQDLLINTADSFRQKVEVKEFMQIAVESTNKTKVDKYRGNPGFWVTPEFLSNHGNSDLPDISVTLTNKQLNLPPEVQRIALPELIHQEKGLFPPKEQTPLWNSRTLNAQQYRGIESFVAEGSEFKKLSIKGTKFGERKCDESSKGPFITITGADSFVDPLDQNLLEEDVVALKIQEREIKLLKNEPRKRSNGRNLDDFTWSLIFKSSGLNITERTIRLENRGTCTINYHWRYGTQGSTLIPETSRSSPFFFNKNKDLILPGQVTVLRVWFRSRVSCSATEFWTLVTDPKLCRAPLVFRFWGCCSPSIKTDNFGNANVELDSDSIDRYLDRRIRDTKVQEIIHGILDNVQKKRLPSPAYGSLFVESEIFQAKNPLYFYHPTVVQQLRDIYDNATSHDSPPWSLSLHELRGILVQLKKPELRNEMIGRFSELCRKCLEPSLYNPAGSTKISLAYNLLCSLFNKFEAEKEYVRTECSLGSDAVKVRIESQGDTSSSTGASRISHTTVTPRKKRTKTISRLSSRTRTSSKTSIITTNSQTLEKGLERECRLYNDVFYLRIRTMLMDTIDGICGVVETVNNLEGCKK